MEWRHCQISCPYIEQGLHCLIEMDLLNIRRFFTILKIFITAFFSKLRTHCIIFLRFIAGTIGHEWWPASKIFHRSLCWPGLIRCYNASCIMLRSYHRWSSSCALRHLRNHIFERSLLSLLLILLLLLNLCICCRHLFVRWICAAVRNGSHRQFYCLIIKVTINRRSLLVPIHSVFFELVGHLIIGYLSILWKFLLQSFDLARWSLRWCFRGAVVLITVIVFG